MLRDYGKTCDTYSLFSPPGLSCWYSHREVRTSSKLSYIHQNSHKNHSILNYKYEHWQYDIIAVKEKD